MKRNLSIISLFIMIFGVSGGNAEEPVSFPDLNLKAVVEAELWVSDPTPTDMLNLTSLNGSGENIQNLRGLDYGLNLQFLELTHNNIISLAPLSDLTNLRTLIVNNNHVWSLQPLTGLIDLRHLDIHENSITDISPLESLTKIRELNLHANYFSNISALSGMTSMEYLILEICQIDDISPLSQMTQLKFLDIRSNKVSDISALLEKKSLFRLYLENNPLNKAAYQDHLQMILDNNPGIELTYDRNVHPPEEVSASNELYPDMIQVAWQEVPNGPYFTSFYRVYRSTASDGLRNPVSDWQTAVTFNDMTAQPGITYDYWVRTSTSDKGLDAGEYSVAVQGGLLTDPILTIGSTAGGKVVVPGEGDYVYALGQTVLIQAISVDPDVFEFAGWTGTAVDGGNVAEPDQMTTEVTLDGHVTLQANFISKLNTIMVDGGNTDLLENGTNEHPFDRIQEAIEVARDGAVIRIYPGYYGENLDCLGKAIQLMGMDPNEPDRRLYPVIDSNDGGPVVSFTQGEGPECLLMGLVLTGGNGAVDCRDSSPTLAHCLIVGNRADGPDMAAVYLYNSQATLANCTIADNLGSGLYLRDSDPVITNTILWDQTALQITSVGTSQPLIRYSDIAGGWNEPSVINLDPLFVRHGDWDNSDDLTSDSVWVAGDYHLQSQAGHWDSESQTWMTDLLTSPCVDGGDPLDPMGLEPVPNGGLINMGAYGGTTQAAKSP